MSVDKILNSKVGGYVALGLLGAAVVWYLSKKASAAVDLVNPMSGNNIANSAVNSVGRAVTGDEGWTLGGSIYDYTHKVDINSPDPVSVDWWNVAGMLNPTIWAGQQIANKASEFDWSGTLEFANPMSEQNIINKGVNAIGAKVTGDTDFSLGSWIYDVLHPIENKTSSNVKIDYDYLSWLSNNTDSISDGGW